MYKIGIVVFNNTFQGEISY